MVVIASLPGILLLALALIHFYWAIFGIKDVATVVPTNPKDNNVLAPSKVATIAVGLILLLLSLVFFYKSRLMDEFYWINYVSKAVGFLFLIRALGDFKYVGFFKRVKNSKFSKLDTKYYSPLCLIIALLILIQEFFG